MHVRSRQQHKDQTDADHASPAHRRDRWDCLRFNRTGWRANGYRPLASLALMALLALSFCAGSQAQNAPAIPGTTVPPQVSVEYFGTEHGYAAGRNDVVFLCIVRNISTVPVPDRTLRMHCYPISGLDYTDGDMTPAVPALTPNQAVAFRWRFAPTDSHQALIAAAQIESVAPPAVGIGRQTSPSAVTLAVVPHFDASPHFGAPIPGVDLAPQAGVGHNEAWVASNRVALRLLTSDRDEPLLLLAAREGAAWHMVSAAMPLARVRAAEDGEIPWSETLRWRNARPRSDKDHAMLTLVGSIGARWTAELTLEVHHDSGAIDGRLRLTARRTMRCFAVQLPRLLAAECEPGASAGRADGSPVMLSEAEPSVLPDDARVVAAHQSGITYGLTWPANPPLPGWTWNRIPAPTGAAATLGVECGVAEGASAGEVVLSGATLEFPFRLFALGPSDTVRDALRFIVP